jgi:bacteriorhodopsin
MDGFVLITQYTFLISVFAMAGGTAYFWLERDAIAAEFRPAVVVAGIYTGVAAFMYWQMHTTVGLDGDLERLLSMPTHVRYIDWIVTTPLILVTIGLLLQLQERRLGLLAIVVAVDIAMIIFGYFGELFAAQEFKAFEAWTMFGLSFMAYLMLLYLLVQFFGEAAQDKAAPVKRAFKFMTLFIVIGWMIYPLGFILGLVWDAEAAKVARELVYNIADIVNKVGLGMVVVITAKNITRDAQIKEAMRNL